MPRIFPNSRIAIRLMAVAMFAWASLPGFGQGTLRFTSTIVGSETRGPGAPQVRGSGALTLSTTSNRSDGSLAYDITVPVARNFPLEAHFHGPAVGGENPIISLAPYTRISGGIRYQGEMTLERRWIADFQAGRWYINLHNVEYENAIMSGFIVPVVPEPGVPALMIVGGAMLAYARARSRKR